MLCNSLATYNQVPINDDNKPLILILLQQSIVLIKASLLPN